MLPDAPHSQKVKYLPTKLPPIGGNSRIENLSCGTRVITAHSSLIPQVSGPMRGSNASLPGTP